MAIKVTMLNGETDKRVAGLYQWDYGQTLEIEAPNLPTIVEVHFACRDMTEAIVYVCSTNLNVATVAIPDVCLEHTGEITAWVYGIEGTSGRTMYRVVIPIIARARPSRSEFIPSEVDDNYTQLISEVNEAVENITGGSVIAAQAQHAVSADRATQADNASASAHATQADRATTADKAVRDDAGRIITDTYRTSTLNLLSVSNFNNFQGGAGRVLLFMLNVTADNIPYTFSALAAWPSVNKCASVTFGTAYRNGTTYHIEMQMAGQELTLYAEAFDGSDTWDLASDPTLSLSYCPVFSLPEG